MFRPKKNLERKIFNVYIIKGVLDIRKGLSMPLGLLKLGVPVENFPILYAFLKEICLIYKHISYG